MAAVIEVLSFKPFRPVRLGTRFTEVRFTHSLAYWLGYWRARRDVYLLEARLAHTRDRRRQLLVAAKDSHREFLRHLREFK